MIAPRERSQKSIGTREWYDFIGRMSDVLPGIHLGGAEATRRLLALCRLDATSRVLDVGCGSGHTACLLVKAYGSQVWGIDLSAVMIEKATARAGRLEMADRVSFQVADIFQLPFEDGSFDVALVESVLTPLPGDKLRALAEMVRILRPGGLIGCNESTVDPAAPPEYLALLAEHPAIYGTFTAAKLRSLFEAAGLEVVALEENRRVTAPGVREGMGGVRGLLSFFVRVYPRILLTLLRDGRFRKASRIDGRVTKEGRAYMGYTLLVGRKPDRKGLETANEQTRTAHRLRRPLAGKQPAPGPLHQRPG